MKVFTSVKELRAELDRTEQSGIGFVPTMGALHAGHRSLVERARRENATVVVSVFVNPTQFNDKNDLRHYPRTPEADARLLERAGADFVLMPSVEEIYPEPDGRQFDFGQIDKVMEGATRPGHFNGVAQVVSRLFDIVRPARAYFGEKDFQQIAVVKAMVAQLALPVEIVECPIVRGDDGLALSSRNALLDEAGWKMGSDGIRHKGDLRAAFTLWYTSGDSTRRDLAEAVRAMLKPIGLEVSLKSGSWEQVEREMHANPVLMGWGSLDPMELYHHYQSSSGGVEFYNPGYYSNPVVDGHLKQALDATDWQAAVPFWQQVEWDGKTGAGVQGDAAWAWLLNVQHTYLANRCIDLGKGAPEIHGSWSLLNNLQDWRWTCR